MKELLKLLGFKSLQNLLLVIVGLLATGIGAFGGLPQPPKLFVDITQRYELLQWILVYVLIWQGAGGYDEYLSLLGTISLFILYKLVEILSDNEKLYKILDLPHEKK
jgi:hypothetical protein